LLAGIAGGATIVLVAAAVLPRVSPQRKDFINGVIFLGFGLGVIASGTLVPALLSHGLRFTWLGLGLFAFVLTAAAWQLWPESETAAVDSNSGQPSKLSFG